MDLTKAKRVVIKVCTSTLSYKTGNLNIRRVERLIKTFSDLKNSGHEIIFVTSGAVGLGMAKAGLNSKPTDMPGRQALAAIGQCELMRIYNDLFGYYNHTPAQILLTRDVVDSPERRENAVNALTKLLEMNVIPVINANDTVSIENLDFDENDTLAATVAQLVKADLLILLTDVAGLYDKHPSDPDAKLVHEVSEITDEMINATNSKGGALASGGMATKLQAAKIAAEDKIPTVIVQGSTPEILYDLFENKAECTVINVTK